VNLACVEAKEFRLAQIAGKQIIVHADELEEIIGVYESKGYFTELIQLMESGINENSDRAHAGMYTELAGLYSKYKEEKLMEFLRVQHGKINIPKVIHYTQMNSQWPELTFLYIHYDEYDNAALTMISHSSDAWEHTLFKDTMTKAANTDICYKAVQFYSEENPLLINDLMTAVVNRVDHSRVVALVRRQNNLPLIKPYLLSVQEKNVGAVNEALNELYLEEEDYEALRKSIDSFDAFDPIALASLLETHQLLEFRRISAYLYKKNGRWSQSVELSKNDKLYQDAIHTAAESKKAEVAETLLDFFVKSNLKECFAAALYTCYDIVRPDVALEMAWKAKIIDFAFPFLIQVLREYTSKIDGVLNEAKKKEQKDDKNPASFTQVQEGFMNQLPAIGYYPDPNMGGNIPPSGAFGMGGMMPGMQTGGFSIGGIDPNMGGGGFGGFPH